MNNQQLCAFYAAHFTDKKAIQAAKTSLATSVLKIETLMSSATLKYDSKKGYDYCSPSMVPLE